jgi:DNA-binding NtrC family response regulator
VPASIPSSSILLIEPNPALCEIVHRYFPACTVDVSRSYEEALTYVPLSVYQVIICPQRTASLDRYALLTLNRRHNPSAPFVITMGGQDFAFVQQAIDHGALGLLDGSHTAEEVIQTVRPLLSLYSLRFSLARREKWMTDYREQLRNNPIRGTWENALIDNRLMCEQALVAVEGSMQALRAYAGDLAAEARQRMSEKEQ